MLQLRNVGPTFVVISADDMSHFPEQSRARFILEHATPGGVQCPQLTETRPCTSLPRCVHYHWQVSTWSTCMLADVTDRCGDHGYRVRGTNRTGQLNAVVRYFSEVPPHFHRIQNDLQGESKNDNNNNNSPHEPFCDNFTPNEPVIEHFRGTCCQSLMPVCGGLAANAFQCI